MSYRGTPYYDMALDAGERGEAAEQMAAMIEADHRASFERAEIEKAQERDAMEEEYQRYVEAEMTLDRDDVNDMADAMRDALYSLADDLHANSWPPSRESVRRLREILTEVEAAREAAHGDDPPDTGATLGLEVRGG